MIEIQIVHTNSSHPDFQILSAELEKELYLRDGEIADVNFELNKIDSLDEVVLIYADKKPVACGGFRNYDNDSVELKRMYVVPDFRKRGLATKVLAELETIAREKGYKNCLLETGKNQPEAIAFYEKYGYTRIEIFGKYVGSANSVCMRKEMVSVS